MPIYKRVSFKKKEVFTLRALPNRRDGERERERERAKSNNINGRELKAVKIALMK